MNANTFTAGAFHISDAKHTEDFNQRLKGSNLKQSVDVRISGKAIDVPNQ